MSQYSSIANQRGEPAAVRILLVEDDPDDVWLMRQFLSDRWREPVELVHVDQLAAAVELCSHADFTVILLDLSLPDSRGLDTFLAMYAGARGAPIVVLSGHDSQAVATKAVQSGAEDYLVKGQVNDRLLERSIRYAIERHRRRRAEDLLQRNHEEFRVVHEIQQRLFPKSAPFMPGFDVAGSLYPAQFAAGDYYDYIPLLDGSWAVAIGDVSSHGVGPALLMSAARACLHTLAQVHTDLGQMMLRLNRLLIADMSDFHFVTLSLLRFDPVGRVLRYSSAGQRGYLLDRDGSRLTLDSTALPLGVRDEPEFPVSEPIPLRAGQIVCFFTDGLPEAESLDHSRYGVNRALEVVDGCRHRPASEIVAALRGDANRFLRQQPQADDITIVIAKVLETDDTVPIPPI